MGNNCWCNVSKPTYLIRHAFFYSLHFYTFLFFLVERCKGVTELRHVDSIVRIHGPQSSFYTVRCKYGYHLLHGEQSYECKNGQWFPQIFSEAKEGLATWATSHRYGKRFYVLPKLLAMIVCGMGRTDLLTVQSNELWSVDVLLWAQSKHIWAA